MMDSKLCNSRVLHFKVKHDERLWGMFTLAHLATVRFVGVYNGHCTPSRVTILVPPSLRGQVIPRGDAVVT